MSIPLNVLIVEDQLDDAELMLYELRRTGYEPVWQCVETEVDYLSHLDNSLDLILADYNLPQFDGLRALDLALARGLDVPFILVSGSIGEEAAVAAMKRGASDYLLKDRLARLGTAVTNALEQRQLRLSQLRAAAAIRESEERLTGIVTSAMDAIITTDDSQKMILFNPAAEKMFLCSATEAIGQPFDRFLHVNMRALFHRYIQSLNADLTARTTLGSILPLGGLRRNGEVFPTEVSISKTDINGQRLYTIILRDITERKRAEMEIQRIHAELVKAYEETIAGWSHALLLRDRETEGHAERVTEMTLRLAQKFNMPVEDIVHIRRGALLHDIGKLGIPDAVLLKPDTLTAQEWEIMRLHPGYAYQMLSPIAYLHPALAIPYCHHERWDGSGYPRGLAGEQIPLAARIFAVVDVWDALRVDRPYRRGWPDDQVYEYLKSLAGKQFDPQIVEVFLKLLADSEANEM